MKNHKIQRKTKGWWPPTERGKRGGPNSPKHDVRTEKKG